MAPNGVADGSSSPASSWWAEATACYHEPKVHDHQLYFRLADINLYVLLPLAALGLFFNAAALVFFLVSSAGMLVVIYDKHLSNVKIPEIFFHLYFGVFLRIS